MFISKLAKKTWKDKLQKLLDKIISKDFEPRDHCFFYSATMALLDTDLTLIKGRHTKQRKGDRAHFWVRDSKGNDFDPTASQYEEGKLVNGKEIDVLKNIDYVIDDPIFKTLPKSVQRKIKIIADENGFSKQSAFSFKPAPPPYAPGEWISHKFEGPGTTIVPPSEEEIWKLKKEPTINPVIEEPEEDIPGFSLLAFGNRPIAWYGSEDIARFMAQDAIEDFAEGRGILKEFFADDIGIMTIPFQPYVKRFLNDPYLKDTRKKIGLEIVHVYQGEGFIPNTTTILEEDEFPSPFNNLSTEILQTIPMEVKQNFFVNFKRTNSTLSGIKEWIYSKSDDPKKIFELIYESFSRRAQNDFPISKRAMAMACPNCFENISHLTPEKTPNGLYKMMTCPSCKNSFYPQDAMVKIDDKHKLDVGNWLEHGVYMLWWGGWPIALYKTKQHADRARTRLIDDFTQSGQYPIGYSMETFFIPLKEHIRNMATKDSSDFASFEKARLHSSREAGDLFHPIRQKARKEYAEQSMNISKVPDTIKPKGFSEGDSPSKEDTWYAHDFQSINDEDLEVDRIDSARKERGSRDKFVEQAVKNVKKKLLVEKENLNKEKLADDNSFTWTKPSIADEVNELLRTSIEEHIPFDSLKRSFNSGILKPLDRKVWQHLENTDSLPVSSVEEAIALAENYGKDWTKIKQAFDNKKSIPAPIILERNDGSIYLIGGNTRLAFARAYRVKPWAYWIKETELFKSPHSLD